jgi:hypothetical protein
MNPLRIPKPVKNVAGLFGCACSWMYWKFQAIVQATTQEDCQ